MNIEKEKAIVKNAYNEYKKTENKQLKKMIRLTLLNNALTYNTLTKSELETLKKEV